MPDLLLSDIKSAIILSALGAIFSGFQFATLPAAISDCPQLMSPSTADHSEPANGPFDSIDLAVRTLAAGRPVVVTDDEDRENEGDLIIAAEKATVEMVNMMILHARGLICVPMTGPHLQRLGIGEMVPRNRESFKTAFTVTVDAAYGITTGISAYDRTQTIRLLADPATTPDQLVQPGHIFPLFARPGGVLERAGHTEAAVDLVALAGLTPCAAICEILKEDGSMARLPDLVQFRERFDVPLVSIAQLIEYRHRTELLVEQVSVQTIATHWGAFDLHVFRERLSGREHHALTLGKLDEQPTLVRMHRMNLVADVFRAGVSDGALVIDKSLQMIRAEGRGALLYMQSEHLSPPHPIPGAMPKSAHEADFRESGIGAQILASLGLRKIRLLSSTQRKVVGLDGFGLDIVEQVPV